MLKFLIISFILFFIVFKLIGFFFRLLIKSSVNSQQHNFQHRQRQSNSARPSDGNVDIEYVPNSDKGKKKGKGYDGGEYIDYEEVK